MDEEFPEKAPGMFDDWMKENRGWPDWFTAGKTAPVCHIQAVAKGFHPTGRLLLKRDGPRCGNCRFLFRIRRNVRIYLKCAQLVDTHGPATDVRAKWPACSDWMTEATDLGRKDKDAN